MNQLFIGREKESQILRESLLTPEAEMVAVIGRRRVGKTELLKRIYKDQIVFELTGLQKSPLSDQLDNFAYAIKKYSNSKLPIQTPESWLKAFILLIDFLETLDFTEKKVVFLDELSWMATPKSGFIQGLGFFWNSWAVNKNIVVAICGSAASWMIENVVNDRGSLHNRITKQISLKPFTLAETEQYFKGRNFNFNHYQIVQIYMAMGGIPHYLKEIKGDKSAVQNIDDICFSDEGLLKTEFSRLYFALFDDAERHIKVIRSLAKGQQGLTRQAILKASKLPESGNSTSVLEELEESGFIKSYSPFGKIKKDMLYRLRMNIPFFILIL